MSEMDVLPLPLISHGWRLIQDGPLIWLWTCDRCGSYLRLTGPPATAHGRTYAENLGMFMERGTRMSNEMAEQAGVVRNHGCGQEEWEAWRDSVTLSS